MDFIFIPAEQDKATHVKTSPYTDICKLNQVGESTRFTFRFITYQLQGGCYAILSYTEIEGSHPLTDDIVIQSRIDYGFAQMVIPIVGFLEFSFQELSAPFYTLQYICVVIWLIQGFFYFAIVMMSCSLISTFIKFYLLRQSRIKLQQLAAIDQYVDVIRINMKSIHCRELVPGDIIQLHNMVVPADCRILSGQALLNEATLTGESAPIPKQKSNIIFEGTRILSHQQGSTALVLRTAYSTVRGQYFRNVLYPPKVTHRFYKQAMKFLAGLLFFTVALAFGTIVIYLDYTTQLIVANLIGTLTWVFPPAMPIFFSITASVALLRLRNAQVIGSNMDKIHISGQINVVCFDKTGTLTTNDMKVHALWSDLDCEMILCCCHHLCIANDIVCGDVLDLEMFKYSGAEIIFEGVHFTIKKGGNQYKILRILDFSSESMMMSVVVEFNGEYYVCCKGAPERVNQKCIELRSGNSQQLQQLTNQGLRVICLANKLVSIEALNWSREQLECELHQLGYLVFINQLKDDSKSVITSLCDSNLQLKILSGDNPLTTVNCGYQCGIVNELIYLLDHKDDCISIIKVQQNGDVGQHFETLMIIKCDDIIDMNKYLVYDCYAMTGDMMQYIRIHGNVDIGRLYTKTKIFARVKPHQKKEVVEVMQQCNNCVAMVGDGSNDCSAISQADIGVSFSMADASYTAHFSSLDQSISCIAKILQEGRCTAQILSEIFALYIILSFLGSAAYTCLATEGQNYSDTQLIFISFGCYLPLIAFMAFSRPLSTLSQQLPLDDMYALPNQLSIYTHIIVLTMGLIGTVLIVTTNPNHIPDIPDIPIAEYLRVGLLNSATVIVALVYSISIPLMLYVSSPFKEHCYNNKPMTIWIIIQFIIIIVFLFVRQSHSFLGLIDYNIEMDNFDIYLAIIMISTITFDMVLQKLISIKYPKILNV